MGKHAPGPWVIIGHNWSDTSIVDLGGETIARLSIEDKATEENQETLAAIMSANANILAAALKMLEALEIAKEALRQQKCTCTLAGHKCYRCYAAEKINQAIAQAEGE